MQDVLTQLTANELEYNDLSNLNGGRFPPHEGHRNGDGVDVQFADRLLQGRDAAHLTALLALLNRDVGQRIRRVGVTFGPGFLEALQLADRTPLVGGRLPSRVIWNWTNHEDHMHFDLR